MTGYMLEPDWIESEVNEDDKGEDEIETIILKPYNLLVSGDDVNENHNMKIMTDVTHDSSGGDCDDGGSKNIIIHCY